MCTVRALINCCTHSGCYNTNGRSILYRDESESIIDQYCIDTRWIMKYCPGTLPVSYPPLMSPIFFCLCFLCLFVCLSLRPSTICVNNALRLKTPPFCFWLTPSKMDRLKYIFVDGIVTKLDINDNEFVHRFQKCRRSTLWKKSELVQRILIPVAWLVLRSHRYCRYSSLMFCSVP